MLIVEIYLRIIIVVVVDVIYVFYVFNDVNMFICFLGTVNSYYDGTKWLDLHLYTLKGSTACKKQAVE